jgi:RecA-family ATPase
MFTPEQSVFINGSAGEPLPPVWEALESKGTRFLRGQLALICAGPGVGKSAFVLAYAVKAKVPTLYFSADSDPFTQVSRMVSMSTGWEMDKSTAIVRSGQLGEALSGITGPLRFNYEASPDLDQLESSVKAFEELYDWPELIIVDNITNVRTGGKANDEDPFGGLEVLTEFLHKMARDTGACIIGLHHVTGPYNDAANPIPLSGVKGQVARVPELVLTLHKIREEFGPDALCVSTVKNRAGRADPSGYEYIRLNFDGPTMQIKDRI